MYVTIRKKKTYIVNLKTQHLWWDIQNICLDASGYNSN